MDLFWLYDLPNWQFFLIVVDFFVGISLLGTFFLAPRLERWLQLTAEHNTIVGTFLSMSGVFYGITLGLISVTTFTTFSATEEQVSAEANALAALYRDVGMLRSPERERMQTDLRVYVDYVIDKAWPLQRQGVIPTDGTQLVNAFQALVGAYEPQPGKDEVIYAEALRQYNSVIERRRARLLGVTGGLPATVWWILLLGALLNIALTWLLVVRNRRLDILINTLSGALLGSLIFLIAALDNPYRGEYSVGPDAFVMVRDQIMK